MIKNNWAVRELQRAMNSMLFERVGLSADKNLVLEKHLLGVRLEPEDVFRNPYMLEFLGLEEKSEYSETDLEQANYRFFYSNWEEGSVLKPAKSGLLSTISITTLIWFFITAFSNAML